VAIGVVGVGGFRALAVGEQHEGVGDDVRQRVHGVGDQALRVGDQADHDLHRGQHDIDADADPGDALAFPKREPGPVSTSTCRRFGHRVVTVGFAGHCGRVYSNTRILSPCPPATFPWDV
jgi:hypothetical protein